jgi:hypothetical protein
VIRRAIGRRIARPWALALALLGPASALAQGAAPSPHDVAALGQAYETSYRQLRGFATAALLAELSDTAEDALIAGSHVRPTSLRDLVRHFENQAHADLRPRLCGRGEALAARGLKDAALASVGAASRDVNVRFSPAHSGRLAALLVRVVESAGPTRFCASDSLRDLGR